MLEPVSVVAGSQAPSRAIGVVGVRAPRRARRCENRRRPAWSVNATSASGVRRVVARWSRRLAVAASRAAAERAERTISCSSSSPARDALATGRLLENDVGVGPSDAERADAGAARRALGDCHGRKES